MKKYLYELSSTSVKRTTSSVKRTTSFKLDINQYNELLKKFKLDIDKYNQQIKVLYCLETEEISRISDKKLTTKEKTIIKKQIEEISKKLKSL